MSGEGDGYRADPSRRQFVLGGALVAASGIAFAAAPRPGAPLIGPGGLEKAIPPVIGRWRHTSSSGLILPPRDETEARIYDQLLTRVYVADRGPAVMLLIAFGSGQTGLFEIHRPEACYPAQGYKMSNRMLVGLEAAPPATIPALFWTAKSDNRTEQVLYWTRIGKYFPTSWAESQIAVVRNNLARKLPDGVLVRMSVISNDATESLDVLRQFAGAVMGSLGGVGRKLLIGRV